MNEGVRAAICTALQNCFGSTFSPDPPTSAHSELPARSPEQSPKALQGSCHLPTSPRGQGGLRAGLPVPAGCALCNLLVASSNFTPGETETQRGRGAYPGSSSQFANFIVHLLCAPPCAESWGYKVKESTCSALMLTVTERRTPTCVARGASRSWGQHKALSGNVMGVLWSTVRTGSCLQQHRSACPA